MFGFPRKQCWKWKDNGSWSRNDRNCGQVELEGLGQLSRVFFSDFSLFDSFWATARHWCQISVRIFASFNSRRCCEAQCRQTLNSWGDFETIHEELYCWFVVRKSSLWLRICNYRCNGILLKQVFTEWFTGNRHEILKYNAKWPLILTLISISYLTKYL